MKTDNEPMRAITPDIKLHLEAEVKYVLAVETTAVMGDRDNWKWVNKAAQKLLRYDMADMTRVGVVSWSNVTRVENKLEVVSEESRERMADTIPGKYQLSDNNIRNNNTSLHSSQEQLKHLPLYIKPHLQFLKHVELCQGPFLGLSNWKAAEALMVCA